MEGNFQYGDIKQIEIKDLHLDSPSFKRKLINAGIKTLDDLLNLTPNEVDSLFDFNTADAILDLQEELEKNPDKFKEKYLHRELNDEFTQHTDKPKTRTKFNTQKKSKISTENRYTYTSKGELLYLPNAPLFNNLLIFEKKAKELLDALDDQYPETMAFQTFEEFSTDIDEVMRLFVKLFEHFHNKQSRALEFIHSHFRNIFLIFVADGARRYFDGDNLWGNFFSAINIPNNNVQADFKTLFIDQLKNRGMPLFAKDDARECYYFSALLHGGLSEQVWITLWKQSLLPLAKDTNAGRYGNITKLNGLTVLNNILDSTSRFSPNVTIRRLLEKAPKSTLSPLFESAIEIANQITLDDGGFGKKQILSSKGMPEAAMLALKAAVKKKISTSNATKTVNSSFAYLPEANMTLDIAEGSVHIMWPKQHFPKDYLGRRVEYYVNDQLANTETIEIEVGRCILPAVDIPIEPHTEYQVEVRIVDADGKALDEFEPLRQRFKSEKEGCFEFILDRNGQTFRLRKRKQRIMTQRRVAFLIKEGYDIEPLIGMKPIQEHRTSGVWCGTKLMLFDIEPGSSGRILDLVNNKEVEIWQERYPYHILKDNAIGRTADGIDVYGFIPSELGTNAGLPVIEIEAIDGQAALDDLEFDCLFNERKIAIPRHMESLDDGIANVVITLYESGMFGYQTGMCTITAKQRSAKNLRVFQYKFFIVPIKDFRVTTMELIGSYPMAKYCFEVTKDIIIENIQGDLESVSSGEQYEAFVPLADESMEITLKSEELGEITVYLLLLGIEIDIPNKLLNISHTRPICLADAIELGSQDGNIWIKANGSRSIRSAYAHLGNKPLALFNMEHPGEYSFNIFRHKRFFLPGNNAKVEDLHLSIDFIYGRKETITGVKPSWADLTILKCQEGFGFKSWQILTKDNLSFVISLNNKTLCDLRFEFRRKRTHTLIDTKDLFRGENEIPIASEIARKLNGRREYELVITPISWFGDAMEDYSYSATLTRKISDD